MGFSPREVDRLTLWEFRAMIDGFNAAHGEEDTPEAPSDEVFDRMMKRHYGRKPPGRS